MKPEFDNPSRSLSPAPEEGVGLTRILDVLTSSKARLNQGVFAAIADLCSRYAIKKPHLSSAERKPNEVRANAEALTPSLLPSEITEVLKDQFGCLMWATDKGTVFVIKAPAHEIDSVRGAVPIGLQHEIYQYPSAPVIRTVLTIYDQSDRPLSMESFTNIEDPQQKAEFAALARQKEAYMLFYDERLQYRLVKQIEIDAGNNHAVSDILTSAEEILNQIPKDSFDFDRAKADVMQRTNLRPGWQPKVPPAISFMKYK